MVLSSAGYRVIGPVLLKMGRRNPFEALGFKVLQSHIMPSLSRNPQRLFTLTPFLLPAILLDWEWILLFGFLQSSQNNMKISPHLAWPRSAAYFGNSARTAWALRENSGQSPRVCAPPKFASTAGNLKDHAKVNIPGSGLRYCFNQNGWQEPLWGKHGAGKSIKDLKFKPPIFIEMRPPSVGLLERLLPGCKVTKGTWPRWINIVKPLRRSALFVLCLSVP